MTRKLTVDEAVEQIRELIDWVDSAYQDMLVVRDGRVVAEIWPADDHWDWMTVLPDSAAGLRGQVASDDSERSS